MSDNNKNRIEGIWPTVRVKRKNTENRTQRKVLQTRVVQTPNFVDPSDIAICGYY